LTNIGEFETDGVKPFQGHFRDDTLVHRVKEHMRIKERMLLQYALEGNAGNNIDSGFFSYFNAMI